MRKFVLGVVAVTAVAVNGAISVAQATSRATTRANALIGGSAGGLPQSDRTARVVAHRTQAAWYVGSSSAGTRVDFRLSPSGQWVRDFRFGSPALPCADHSGSTFPLGDGSFPLVGIRVSHGRFHGNLSSEESTPNNPYGGNGASVSGRFIDQRHVTGTATTEDRACDRTEALIFTATRVRLLPARPTRGRRYVGRTRYGTVGFRVSRSGRRVSAFRFSRVGFSCEDTDGGSVFTLTHSYPTAGLAQNRDGEFAGVLSSRLTASGHAAGARVLISVLFLSAREATGTVRLLGKCRRLSAGQNGPYETLVWRAALAH